MTRESFGVAEPSWHDNLIYGLQLRPPDPERGIWRSDLLLDIDHIVEWVRDPEGGFQFRVAPATLSFHDVTELKIEVEFGQVGGQRQTLNALSIAQIVKQPLDAESHRRQGPYDQWRIELNLPPGGVIAFGASGMTQTLRAEPRLVDEQHLPPDDRPSW